MSRLIRYAAEGLRKLSGKGGNKGERRAAPRLAERRQSRFLFSLSVLEAGGVSGPLIITGHTRDISRTGVALVMPSLTIGGRDLTRTNRRLLLELDLPSGPVRFQAEMIWFKRLGVQDGEGGYLMGVRIAEISETAQSKLTKHLREARRSPGQEGGAPPVKEKGPEK